MFRYYLDLVATNIELCGDNKEQRIFPLPFQFQNSALSIKYTWIIISIIALCEGVEKVKTDYEANKLTVTGNVDPAALRDRVAYKTKKKVELVSPQPKKEGGDKKAEEKPEKKAEEKKGDDKKPKEVNFKNILAHHLIFN